AAHPSFVVGHRHHGALARETFGPPEWSRCRDPLIWPYGPGGPTPNVTEGPANGEQRTLAPTRVAAAGANGERRTVPPRVAAAGANGVRRGDAPRRPWIPAAIESSRGRKAADYRLPHTQSN